MKFAALEDATREFPSLRIIGPECLSGHLVISGAMLGKDLLLNPEETVLEEAEIQATFVLDSFNVEIGSTDSGPYLKLLGSRPVETAERFGIPLIDLHVYADQTACFAAPQQIYADWTEGMTISEFVWKYALPFLYQQAFFSKHGRWPWGELAHGALGLIEWLARESKPTEEAILRTIICLEAGSDFARKLIARRARRHHKCPCGSHRRLSACHPDVKRGIDLIRSWIAQSRTPRFRKLLHPAMVSMYPK